MRINFSILKWLCAMFVLFGMASCDRFSMDRHEDQYDRTVLVYMAAENSLAGGSFHTQDIDEMIQAAGDIPKNSRLLLYVDDTRFPRIMSVEKSQGRPPEAKVLHNYTAELNSGDAETLQLVMEWVVEHSPSLSYGLVFWSHGDAWLPAKAPIQRSICVDNERNGFSDQGTKMDIVDVADVLSAFPRFEFIMFDACFMQAIEVAYDLRRVARYVIASPAEIPNPGAPYERMVRPFFSIPFDAEAVVDGYYTVYNDSVMNVFDYGNARYGVSLSAIDCDFLDELAEMTAEMVVKYVSKDEDADLEGVQRYYPLSKSTRPEFHDMNGYMLRVITDEADYARWKSVFDRAVPYAMSTSWWYSNDAHMQYVDMDKFGGVSCYVPQNISIYSSLNKKFCATSWYKVSGWSSVGW